MDSEPVDATKNLTEPQSLIDPLHYSLFPEEFDHISDSIFDARQRLKGASPMSSDYINHINLRRREIGFGVTYKAEGTQTEGASFEDRDKLLEALEGTHVRDQITQGTGYQAGIVRKSSRRFSRLPTSIFQ